MFGCRTKVHGRLAFRSARCDSKHRVLPEKFLRDCPGIFSGTLERTLETVTAFSSLSDSRMHMPPSVFKEKYMEFCVMMFLSLQCPCCCCFPVPSRLCPTNHAAAAFVAADCWGFSYVAVGIALQGSCRTHHASTGRALARRAASQKVLYWLHLRVSHYTVRLCIP